MAGGRSAQASAIYDDYLMKVIIYHPNSFGGTYEHAQYLYQEYAKQLGSGNCQVLFPTIAKAGGPDFKKYLLTDKPNYRLRLANQLHFLWRTFANPVLLWWYIRRMKDAVVVFNEFDQFSMWLWGPLFRLTQGKRTYAVILHDPDRDAYAGNATRSGWLMRQVMRIMDIAFYHEVLPDKPYYRHLPKTRFVNVMLGLMPVHQSDESLSGSLNLQTDGFQVMSILGNIRLEKNYHLAIEALVKFPTMKLVIGGRPASSAVSIDELKAHADELGVADRVIWIVRFLSDEELASIIRASDVSCLNYSATFKSQSGVMTLVAPYRKPMIVSDGESALAAVVKKYQLGVWVKPDDLGDFCDGLHRLLEGNLPPAKWDEFEAFANWESNVRLSLTAFEECRQKD